jgi:16S rRNA A1518/A1519 N6-dimethyltransferase RsmA/KsgA/DIM1 with predicted DNA glycosylase/AP lyase activity
MPKRDYSKFFTPPDVADYMVNLFGKVEDGSTFIEPHAGNGALVKALRKKYGGSVVIDAVELDNDRYDELEEVCDKVFSGDFLEHYSSGEYDYCIDNPPFGNGIDLIAHLEHITEVTKIGAKIVMIVPEDFNPSRSCIKHPLENWSKNSDGTTTPIKIIEFINK